MFELKSATRAKLHKMDDKSIEVGKNQKLATIFTLSVRLPNSALEMFDPALREILYSKASPGEGKRKQAQIEGVDAVSDMPALTATGAAIAKMPWGREQTGCTFGLEYGTGKPITFPEATSKNFKITLEEGGAIKVSLQVHAPVEHLTGEQFKAMHNMHQRDVKVTLIGPAAAQQQEIEDDDAGDDKPAGSTVTPIQALANAERRARGEKAAAT